MTRAAAIAETFATRRLCGMLSATTAETWRKCLKPRYTGWLTFEHYGRPCWFKTWLAIRPRTKEPVLFAARVSTTANAIGGIVASGARALELARKATLRTPREVVTCLPGDSS